MSHYYRPLPISAGEVTDAALPLGGTGKFFYKIAVLSRSQAPRIVLAKEAPAAVLEALTAPRPAFAGLSLDRPRLMGILNITPDSFSDGGRFLGAEAAQRQAAELARGADLIDIGGESTRPGAREVPAEEEMARVVPVIEALRDAGLTTPISVDTRKAAVARAALDAGADVINDVSGFRFDPELADVVAERNAPVILMHSIGTPETMQAQAKYDDVVLDVYDALAATRARAEAAGIPRGRILLDPGIGFGKTDDHNLALLRRLSLFHALGCGLLLGVSRKGFIGRLTGTERPDQRDAASAALGLLAVAQGIQMLRVHDIGIHRQLLAVADALGT